MGYHNGLPHSPALTFLCDTASNEKQAYTEKDRFVEPTSYKYYVEFVTAVKSISKDVLIYTDLKTFTDELPNHPDRPVLSTWFGGQSRNRRSMVPAICEASRVPYVGADAYANLLCADKYWALEFARHKGLKTPSHRLIWSPEDIGSVETLPLPQVIKPLAEGSSIGILQTNLVKNYMDARQCAERLLQDMNSPIVAEEFIPGREVSVVLIGKPDDIQIFECMELIVSGDETYLYDKIWDIELKKNSEKPQLFRCISSEFPKSEWSKIRKLYNSLGKMDYMRVDGRLNLNGFVVGELSPDAHLGSDNALAQAAACQGYDYNQFFRLLYSLASPH